MLSKCLDGKTHNQKESVNSIIWNRLPKSIFVGATVLELGVYAAVAPFNMGSGAPTDILQEEGLHPGCYFEGIWKADKKRVKKADCRATPEAKTKRKVLRGQTKDGRRRKYI